ncbi:hypothetical protein SDRG_00986 [Saprolegnia diclina VS20]|uniref:Uncharacterized protein n=1 Tax=Saprolegnia diclina (strain VS20) TaxID=1156394 RepID=T0R5C5_SAPDV|nr:hypothetical protein SDRG_00986 [Saprolegnia diclina VS20]EQC42146.1 hypothetical protein SDRG_00986 [Saprolegnia diclina VS20]|eukprot:XP_008604715.1 hypothetical protein SDRG_00986 [Saprolegnia diclina VS20]
MATGDAATLLQEGKDALNQGHATYVPTLQSVGRFGRFAQAQLTSFCRALSTRHVHRCRLALRNVSEAGHRCMLDLHRALMDTSRCLMRAAMSLLTADRRFCTRSTSYRPAFTAIDARGCADWLREAEALASAVHPLSVYPMTD